MKISRPKNRVRQILSCAIEPLESRSMLSAVTLDAAFGGPANGHVLTQFNGEPTSAFAVALSGGKILVAGSITFTTPDETTHTYTTNDDFVLARYNADGTLDTSFGNNGFITTDFGSTTDAA